jgi:hypothetical protein
MIRLSAERESKTVRLIKIRSTWRSEQWTDTWAVVVSEHLAVNRDAADWIITRIPTGLSVGSASNLRDAIRVGRQVAHWPEWAVIHQKDDITPEFRHKAKRQMSGGMTIADSQVARLAQLDSLLGRLARNITEYSEREGIELHCAIRDAVSDIRHLCDIHRLDFEALEDQAREMYLEELGAGQ